MLTTIDFRRRALWTVSILVLLALLISFAMRNRLPSEIVVATATQGGLYHRLAESFESSLEARADRPVSLISTDGSAANREMLLSGGAHLAILQSGTVDLEGLAVLTPLYDEVIHVLVRPELGASDLPDLRGRRVALGLPGSGMRVSAEAILGHYGIDPADLEETATYFGELTSASGFDAAIVTTGLLNPDLERLAGSGAWSLLPILDAEAFVVRHPMFVPFSIPRGLYGEDPPQPPTSTPTLATTAVLAARADVPDRLIDAALAAIYAGDLHQAIPTLMSSAEAAAWHRLAVHPTARRHFDPYGGIDLVANLMESLAAIKELLVAVGAGFYLLWTRRRWRQARAQEAVLVDMKERLDKLLDRTARIERAQMTETDRGTLQAYLDEVTEIKLEALDELSHEDLRGDRMFLIFLIQCGALVERIQARISNSSAAESIPKIPAGSDTFGGARS